MNKDKPRIAFCFSGQARTLDQTYLFFQKNLFDVAKEQGFEYDVFCAVEDDGDLDKVNLLNPTKIEKIKSSEVEKIIEKKWGPDYEKFLLKNCSLLTFGGIKSDKRFLNSLLQQFYKVSKCIDMMCSHGQKYNLVVRLRFDCFLFNRINFETIVNEVRSGKIIGNKFNCSKYMLRLWEINDFFFFGSEESMKTLRNLFDDLAQILKCGQRSKKFEIIYYFCTRIKNVIYYLNNKVFKHWIFPEMPIRMFESLFYKTYTSELICYDFFIQKGIKIKKSEFSYILIRKKTEESVVRLENKNRYEL